MRSLPASPRAIRLLAHAAAAVSLVSLCAAPVRADVQNPAQQRCAVKITSTGLKLAKTQGKEVRACLRGTARNGLASL